MGPAALSRGLMDLASGMDLCDGNTQDDLGDRIRQYVVDLRDRIRATNAEELDFPLLIL